MSSVPDLEAARAALDGCDAALRKLDAGCCEPGRSPRMASLAATLEEARRALDRVGAAGDGEEPIFAHLETAGAQVGSLQVGCCTPKRLPLYADILEGLTTAQLVVSAALGQGHLGDSVPSAPG